MPISPSDYCISLSMAQRPELHAAMKQAGCGNVGEIDDPANPCDGYSDFVWYIRKDCPPLCIGRDYLCSTGWACSSKVYPAYHLGELICAMKVLAALVTPGREVMINTMEGYSHAGAWATWADSDDDLHPSPFHGPHLPDAGAELVIALAKGGAK